MAVDIRIMVEENQTQEYKAIEALKKNLEYDFNNNYPNAKGEVYLYSNMNLYGCNGCGVSDLDILIVGNLENVYVDLVYHNNTTYSYRIDSFILTVEHKSHTQGIKWDRTQFSVRYANDWSNVSKQSENQKYAMKTFLNKENINPIVNNVIWFRGITQEDLRGITTQTHNAVAGDCTFRDIMQARFNTHMIAHREVNTGEFVIRMSDDKDMFNRVTNLFREKKLSKSSGITRKRLELLNNNNNAEDCKKLLGPNFTILKGRAGTGKTITLLQAAIRQSATSACVVLTYNNALLGDIKRLMKYRNIDGGTRVDNIEFYSTQEFFCRLMKNYNIQVPNDSNINFETQYSAALTRFAEQVKQVNSMHDEYIFIDEAQDWKKEEMDILFRLYPPKNIIVADGIDQFVRQVSRVNWEGIEGESLEKKVSLRQKCNLVEFINTYAEENYVDWHVEPNVSLVGGRIVFIETAKYTKGEHDKLVESCSNNGCTNYDILLLVTPSYVEGSNSGRFKCTDAFNKCGFIVFDGTNMNNRKAIPMGDNECRVFQYDSCRGLEGWSTVCIDFDELIEYKYNVYRKINNDDIAYKQAILWSLMPLTRAIDTVVITLKNPNGRVGNMLKELADKFDYAEWNI
jgi:hypothetical protein